MPIGPGKYDDLCTEAQVATNAQAVVLAVIDGDKGSGFSVQSVTDPATWLPGLLRLIADEIERAGALQ